MREGTRPRVEDERQGVRALALVVALLALIVTVVFLAVGNYIPAAGCGAAALAAGWFSRSLYADMHQEALARDARARATRAVADPFEGE